MALATATHQSTMLSSNQMTIRKQCVRQHSLVVSNMVSFPVGCSGHRGRMAMFESNMVKVSKNAMKLEDKRGMKIISKTGKVSKSTSADTEKKWSHYGVITETLPNGMFYVGLVNLVDNKFIRVNDDVILGYVSGKIRMNKIKIVPGDTVQIELSPYDSNKGRILYRLSRRDIEKLTGSGSKDDHDD